MFRHTIPSIIQLFTPSVTWKVKTTDKVLYLTFDDGPHPSITPFVLNELKKYNAKATFFCVGENVLRYPEVVKETLLQGHQIGNHTHNHLSGWRTHNKAYEQNIELAAKVIDSKLFRPPYGQITPGQIQLLKSKYTIVMWDVLTMDYKKGLNIKRALKYSYYFTKPGSIVVFHDSEKAFAQLKVMLPAFLEKYHRLGYRFETL